MKKYLICGAMALAAGLFITSCTHDDIGYDNLYDEKTQTFDKVFKDLYGNIDPSHDWGFTPYVDITDASTSSSSRALTRGVNANANEWADPSKEYGGWIVPNALTEAQKDKVRRWFQAHQNPEGVAFSYKDFFVQQVYKGGTEGKIGPNSPEKYTAANGGEFIGSEHMDHLTCGTWGQGATTTDNDGRNFYDHIYNFNNGTYNGGGTVSVLDNGQSVGGSTHPDQIALMVDSRSDAFGYYNSNGSVGHNLYVIIPGDEIQEWDSTGGDNANVSGMFFVGLDFEQLIGDNVYTSDYYTGPDGNKYRYLNSNKNQYCGDLKKIDPAPQGNDAQKLLDDGYRPVQNTADKDWVKLAKCADGYYSDWIVRVIPGTKKSTNNNQQTEKEETSNKDKYKAKRHVILAKGRVFVEDLYNANRADIDYNDAVFDAIIWKDQDVIIDRTAQDTLQVDPDGVTKYRLEIALLAAGGTIPLTIGGSMFGDVHDRFGVGLTTIVNTVGEASNVFGSSVTGKDYVYDEIDITDVIDEWKGNDPITLNIIPIDVLWTTDNVTVAARLNNRDTHTYQKDDDGRLVTDTNGNPIIVDSDDPVVPHVLQVPIGTAWSQERVNIGLKDEGPYHLFPNYVSNEAAYKNRVWVENVNQFYLYADNRTPLAYSSYVKYPVGYSYLTNITASGNGTEIPIWENNSGVGDNGWYDIVGSQPFNDNNVQSTDILRVYAVCTSNSWQLKLTNQDWKDIIYPGVNKGSCIQSYGTPAGTIPTDGTLGYQDFPLTEYNNEAGKNSAELLKEFGLKAYVDRLMIKKVVLVR